MWFIPTLPREIFGLSHSFFTKNLNFQEKIVILRMAGLGPLCCPSRIDAWLMDFFELLIPEMFDFHHS